MDAVVAQLLDLLVCPEDGGALENEKGALVCRYCQQSFPIDADGIVSFLPDGGADASGWDEEAESYAAGFNQYTEAVEVSATVQRIGSPAGPVLDHGAGTGRMTAALHLATGQPVIALDYSRECLRLLLAECRGLPVLAIHADACALPLRDEAVAAVCSAGVHPLLRPSDRRRMVAELARVLPPDGTLVLSTLNYSWLFRAWSAKGNPGAKRGEHLHGKAIYYERSTSGELRRELVGHFTITEMVGVRNLPGRSFAIALQRLGGRRGGWRLSGWVERYGPSVDRALEHLPLSRLTGFMLLSRSTRTRPDTPADSGGLPPVLDPPSDRPRAWASPRSRWNPEGAAIRRTRSRPSGVALDDPPRRAVGGQQDLLVGRHGSVSPMAPHSAV